MERRWAGSAQFTGEMGSRRLQLLILLLTVAVHNGRGLRCYHCQATTNPQCLDPLSASPRMEPPNCLPETQSAGTPRCLKVVRQAGGGSTEVSRSCVLATPGEPDATCADTASDVLQCSLCDTDGCNDARRLWAPSWALLWAGVLIVTTSTVM